MYLKETLGNGLRLITVPFPHIESVTVLLMFRVGSRYETRETWGLSHFLEHLMFKGTERRPNTLAISRELDSLGAEYNAFTSKDYTGYYIKVNAEKLRLVLDMMADMILHSRYDAKELEREKQVIYEEIKMYRENPMMYIEEFFEALMYDGSTLGWDISGSPHSLAGITRQQVLDYKNTHYLSANGVLAIVGRLDPSLHDWVDEFFVQPFQTADTKRPSFRRFHHKASKLPCVNVDRRVVEQTQVGLGFPAYPYEHEYLPAERLLAIILGGNMSSRLFIRVRERLGYAYSVSASPVVYEDTGHFFIQAGVDAKRLEAALRAIFKELSSIVKKGVTTAELRRAKDFLKGKLILSFEDSEHVAHWYSKQELILGMTLTHEEYLRRFETVTVNDIQTVAREIFHWNKMRLALIGPVDDGRVLLRETLLP